MSETVTMKYSYIFLSFLGKETQAVNKLRMFSKGKYLHSDQLIIRKIHNKSRQFQKLQQFLWIKDAEIILCQQGSRCFLEVGRAEIWQTLHL
jgi:hypothetical protein